MGREIQVWCDICSKPTKEKALTNFIVYDISVDVCQSCQRRIVSDCLFFRCVQDKILRPFCKKCKGKGQVKECIGGDYHRNDYGMVKCEECY